MKLQILFYIIVVAFILTQLWLIHRIQPSGPVVKTNPSLYKFQDLAHDGKDATRTNSKDINIKSLESPLHDQTLPWDFEISQDRIWLNNFTKNAPPVMLVLTEFGFNHPNQTYGANVYRGIRYRELMEGVINHPWFNPHGWNDLLNGRIVPNVAYYIFLDHDTCMEKNYPNYMCSMEGLEKNSDRFNGRNGTMERHWIHKVKQVVKLVLSQRSVASSSRYILFECSGGWGGGPKSSFYNSRMEAETAIPGQNHSSQIVWVTLSSNKTRVMSQDLGLPPPALKPCSLSPAQKQEIRTTCNQEDKRTTVLSFAGNLRHPLRRKLAKFNNNDTIKIYKASPENPSEDLALSSLFAAVPRGDNLFTYRFTEVLSCAAIPILFSDGWLLPLFSEEEWAKAIIHIPQKDAKQTLDIVESISKQDRCVMRRQALELYERYIKDGKGIVHGIVEQLQKNGGN